MVVALIALMIALGGTSYAVVKLPARSVGARELRTNAVTGSKVKADSLTGADIKEATLGKVPSAASADRAVAADHAAASAALDTIFYVAATQTVPAPPAEANDPTVAQTTFATQLASCAAGQHVVGGGVKLDSPENMAVVDSYPTGATGWTAHVSNDHLNTAHGFVVYAICAPSAATG